MRWRGNERKGARTAENTGENLHENTGAQRRARTTRGNEGSMAGELGSGAADCKGATPL